MLGTDDMNQHYSLLLMLVCINSDYYNWRTDLKSKCSCQSKVYCGLFHLVIHPGHF